MEKYKAMSPGIREKAVIFFSTGAWSGFSPVASGTVGSLVGLLLFIPISDVGFVYYSLLTALLTLFGVWVSGLAETIFGEKDSGRIVIDEIAGMLLTMLSVPATWEYMLSGFLLFRIFDIFKPFPKLERLPGGWGVMLDDIAAGAIANLILRLLIFFNIF